MKERLKQLASQCVRTLTVMSIILPLSWTSPGSVLTQDKQQTVDAFFGGLLVGGAVKGKIYIEAPLKPAFFANAKTREEKWDVWSSFFKRAVKDTPDYTDEESVPYWGDYIYRMVDLAYVAGSVELQVGDVVKVRTPSGLGTATVTGYQIHHSEPGGSDLLLAVARPGAGFKVLDTNLLVAARDLPACKVSCMNKKTPPDRNALEKIREVVRKGGKIPEKVRLGEITALSGHFTRRDKLQYFVYAIFGNPDDPDVPSYGYWRTMVLDSDFSVIAILGENEYEHIKPISVGDINSDGLDEIWTDLQGYEGRHAGIIYWRGGDGKRAFGMITTSYYGA